MAVRGVTVAVISPVYDNAPTLEALRDRLARALAAEDWRLHLVVDACPRGSGAAARSLAAADPRVSLTELQRNGGQHAALVTGLRRERDADAWVLLDADLQDPPEAVPLLLERLRSAAPASGVFAGRRGVYTSPARRLTGRAHRGVLHALTGLPPDAGAFVVLDRSLRDAILDHWDHHGAPSVVAAAGLSGLPLASVPVVRHARPEGSSAWTSRARLRQGVRTAAWAVRHRSANAQNPPAVVPSAPSTLVP